MTNAHVPHDPTYPAGLPFSCSRLHEAVGAEHRGQLRLQQLERNLSLVPEILGEIHGRPSALAEMTLDAIAASEGRVEAVGLLVDARHGADTTSVRGTSPDARHP